MGDFEFSKFLCGFNFIIIWFSIRVLIGNLFWVVNLENLTLPTNSSTLIIQNSFQNLHKKWLMMNRSIRSLWQTEPPIENSRMLQKKTDFLFLQKAQINERFKNSNYENWLKASKFFYIRTHIWKLNLYNVHIHLSKFS